MDKADSLFNQGLYDGVYNCTACAIRQYAKHPIPPEGWRLTTTLVLGQNPSVDEERAKRLFVGQVGEELDRWLRHLRIDRKVLALASIVHCRTEKSRAPRVGETKVCADRWFPALLDLLPNLQVILALGRAAHSVVLPKMNVPLLDMSAVHVTYNGSPSRAFMVYPLVHPSYILRIPGERARQQDVLTSVRAHWSREYAEAYSAVSI